MNGIYLRNDHHANPDANTSHDEADQSKQFVDFQIILNEEEFRELERRKQTFLRQEHVQSAKSGIQR